MSPKRKHNLSVDHAKDDNPDIHYKVDKRYRESDYFLEDQLLYAESVQEFRAIKEALTEGTGLIGLTKLAFSIIRNS